ncbi:MAG: hypothetical protein AAF705_10035, partial [Bacteroidota bacterium]
HKALLSVLKPNRGNKCHQSRLCRWIDRLLHFNFRVQNIPETFVGLADYLSRHPNEPAEPENNYDEQFALNLIKSFNTLIKLDNSHCKPDRPNKQMYKDSTVQTSSRTDTVLFTPAAAANNISPIEKQTFADCTGTFTISVIANRQMDKFQAYDNWNSAWKSRHVRPRNYRGVERSFTQTQSNLCVTRLSYIDLKIGRDFQQGSMIKCFM